MTADPASPVAAYCAPGLKAYAARLLDTSGETYREVIEHNWMAGRTDVILAVDPPWVTGWPAGTRLTVSRGEPVTDSWPTGMRLHAGEPWDVSPDLALDPDRYAGNPARQARGRDGNMYPTARLRRVGWLDQKGRVWLATPPMAQFDGGSLTPLLIDARED